MISLVCRNSNVKMSKPTPDYLILSTLILSVVLISSLPVQSYALNTMFSGPAPKTTSRTYVNEEHGFQFEPPKGWAVKDESKNGIKLAPNKGNAFLYTYASESSINLDTATSTNEMRKKFERVIIDAFSHIPGTEKILSPKFTYYDDGVKITFSVIGTMADDREKTPMKGQMAVWMSQDKGKVYGMLYAGDKDSYKTHLQVYKTALKSFYVFPT